MRAMEVPRQKYQAGWRVSREHYDLRHILSQVYFKNFSRDFYREEGVADDMMHTSKILPSTREDFYIPNTFLELA